MTCYKVAVALPSSSQPERVMFWGTYDLSKPRNRILLAGLRENGVQVEECHESIWESVRDKGTLAPLKMVVHLVRAGLAYPRLLARFARGPAPEVLIVGYLGQLDVLLIAPLARWRGVVVVWDQFISLYDTVVHDRQKVSPSHALARLLYAWEWLACRAADCVVMDTREHADYVARTFGLPAAKVASVWVGAETAVFRPVLRPVGERGPLRVLFYGQLIPLHGVRTIIEAARLLRGRQIRFDLIGTGQEEPLVARLLSEEPLPELVWRHWVDYERLIESIEAADVCLGIFGTTAKAGRVIPNKVFQILAAGRPLITRESPAIRELIGAGHHDVHLVPPGDPGALAEAIVAFAEGKRDAAPRQGAAHLAISPRAVGAQLLEVLDRVRRRSKRAPAKRPPLASGAHG